MAIVASLLLKAALVLGIAKLVPGIRISGYKSALMVAGLYALLHLVFFKVIALFTLPFIVLTLGAFLLVINGFLLWVTDKIIDSFEIRGMFPLAIATVGLTAGSLVVEQLVSRIF